MNFQIYCCAYTIQDLKLPHLNVSMKMTRAPLTTVSEGERTFARMANLRPEAQKVPFVRSIL